MTNHHFKAIWQKGGKKEMAIICNVPDVDWARVKLHDNDCHAGEVALIDCSPCQLGEQND